MIPRIQTKFGKEGNCLETCLCSIFEIKGEIPDFGKDTRDWYDNMIAWLVPFGVRPVELMLDETWNEDEIVDWMRNNVGPDVIHLISGDGPRGLRHSVVGQGGRMIHDPHPDGGGVEPQEFTFFVVPNPKEITDLREQLLDADALENANTNYRDMVEDYIVNAHSLSAWAAAINWDGSPNEQEWLDGLRARIETVQNFFDGIDYADFDTEEEEG